LHALHSSNSINEGVKLQTSTLKKAGWLGRVRNDYVVEAIKKREKKIEKFKRWL